MLMAMLAPFIACDTDEGVLYDLAVKPPAETGPQKDGIVDAPGDLAGQDRGQDMDLAAGGDLDTGPSSDSGDLDASGDAEAGSDMDATVADLDMSPDAPGDMGSDILKDGMADGAAPSGYTLLSEVVSGSAESTGVGFRLVSQVGHPVEPQTLSGGDFTLRLRAVATIN